VFAVLGDSRNNPALYKQLLDRVVADGNAFVIHTGDLVEHGTQGQFARFQALMADFSLPFYPVPGNHDRDLDGSLAPYLAMSGAPAPYYSFDVETAHFTMVNSASGHLTHQELDWIDRDLSATKQRVKFVALHHPPFDPDGTGHILHSGNDAFMALMRKHGVDYVFAGHIHAYSQAMRDGTVYVITGGGGAPLYHEHHPNAFHHYVRVTVDGNQVRADVIRVAP